MKLFLVLLISAMLALAETDRPFADPGAERVGAAAAENQTEILAEATELPISSPSRTSVLRLLRTSLPVHGIRSSGVSNAPPTDSPPGEKLELYALNLALLI